MTIKTWTGVLLVVGLFLYIFWDIFAELHSNADTISVIVKALAKVEPIVPMSLGILLGHLFGSRDIATLWLRSHIMIYSEIPLLIGLVLGRIVWGQ